MATTTTITSAALQFQSDVDIAHNIVHGDIHTVVQTENGPVVSFSKLIYDANILVSNASSLISSVSFYANAAALSAQYANANAIVATNEAIISTNQALIATNAVANVATQVSQAATYAVEAATQAALASNDATNAASSAASSLFSANVASSQASVSITQANIATFQAAIATTQAGYASANAAIATTQANLSSFYANNSANSAANAASSLSSLLSLTSVTPAPNKILLSDGTGKISTGWLQNVLFASNNLSDLGNASQARINLGLGTISTQNSNGVMISGGTIDSTNIGSINPAAASFTTLSATNYANVGQLVTSNIWSSGGSINNVVIGNVAPASGSFTTLTANSGITGILSTAAQPNITSVGTLTSLVTANAQISGGAITSTPISGSTGSFTTLSGTIQTAAQPNITSVGTLTSLNVTNATTTGSLITSNAQITGGAITSTPISGSTGSFTTLTANTPTSPDNSSNVATTAFTALQFVPSAGASNIKPNTTWTAINPNASAATICGGGDPLDMQLVGYGHNHYETPNGPGTSVTYPFTPINNVVSSLNIFSIATDNTILKLTYTSGTPGANQWTGNISGSNVAITLGTSLTGTARAIVEDPNVVVPTAGSVSGSHSYAYILGGYDNALDSISLAMQVAGMHHRIMGSGTNHPTAIGGSFHRHYVGSYNGTFAGTGLEMSGSATNGSVALGGLFTTVTGSTAVALACERSKISGAYGFGQGQNHNVSGTASAALGRNNTISGSDSLIVGNGNSSTGNYSFISGNTNVVSHTHSSVNGGYKAYTSWQGQRVQWAYRDTTNPSSPFRQVSYVDLSQFTSNTSPALLQTLDSVSNISMPAGAVWKCKLNVVARGGNLRGATFDADFSLQTNATPTMTLIDTPIILSVVDAGMGTGANAAAISVGVVSNALNITVQPRGDTPVSTKWFGWLQIIEVT